MGSKNFKYLDELIHGGAKEIVLDSDIVLSDGEESEYLKGIKLDVDDLAIDGNGYTINAQGKARIFCCTGKNIIIKNIVLKKGFAENGGAIHNEDAELIITESLLQENTSEVDGGAIRNDEGSLTITKSTLQENTATKGDGGAIDNFGGEVEVTETTFAGNTASYDGGAICLNEPKDLNRKTAISRTINLMMFMKKSSFI